MNKKLGNSIAIAIATLSFNASATNSGLEQCIANVKKQKAGDIVKLEKLAGINKPMYELEIKDANGFEWEFICDAESGKITETESEVGSAASLAFKNKKQLTEEDAAAIALKAHPGIIEEVEYEIEDDGNATYEFDIVDKNGVETKVEVDAASGKIIEAATEEWEIGEEQDEKR